MEPALAKEVQMLTHVRSINEAIDIGDSKVQQFYKDTTILITGGSGFMGKHLLEKILRSCDVKKVFLLIRPKKDNQINERLSLILQDPVFDTIKRIRPGFENKIYLVLGDVAEPKLGITMKDRASIIAETEIIIHAAATISFNEPLKVAVNTNVRGTVEMLNLGKQCKKLKSYVHVSTAYSHATFSRINGEVNEQFYDAPLTPQLAIEMVETMDEKRLNDITPALIQNWPNTYTFSKAIAEEAVRQVGVELPISIVRPGIVIPSFLEPSPGWMDLSCAFGPSGIVLGSVYGVLHTMIVSDRVILGLVPVDLVNNAIILSGWAVAKQRQQGEYAQKIYTVSNMRNPTCIQVVADNLRALKNSYMSPKVLYYTFMLTTSSPIIHAILNWLFHYIPGYIADFVLQLMGKKPIAVKLYSKMDKQTKVFSYFGLNEWFFKDNNLLGMYQTLNSTDKKIYNCDVATFDWEDMISIWVIGTRKYLIKDGLQGTENAVKKHFWFKIVHYSVVTPLFFYLLYKFTALVFIFVYLVLSNIFGIF